MRGHERLENENLEDGEGISAERKKRTTSEGSLSLPNEFSEKLLSPLTLNRNFPMFWQNDKHPGSISNDVATKNVITIVLILFLDKTNRAVYVPSKTAYWSQRQNYQILRAPISRKTFRWRENSGWSVSTIAKGKALKEIPTHTTKFEKCEIVSMKKTTSIWPLWLCPGKHVLPAPTISRGLSERVPTRSLQGTRLIIFYHYKTFYVLSGKEMDYSDQWKIGFPISSAYQLATNRASFNREE